VEDSTGEIDTLTTAVWLARGEFELAAVALSRPLLDDVLRKEAEAAALADPLNEGRTVEVACVSDEKGEAEGAPELLLLLIALREEAAVSEGKVEVVGYAESDGTAVARLVELADIDGLPVGL
jgi:hypothetical protein